MSKPLGEAESLGLVQGLIDELAAALGRSVAVDNAHLELLCASAQIGPIDRIRVEAIINRAPPPDPVPWMLGRGIATSVKPVRLPANDDFGMLARVCFPIRADGALLGYLWLFDEPPVSADDMAQAGRTVDQLVAVMRSADLIARGRADDLANLLEAVAASHTTAAAAEDALARGYLPASGRFSVHVFDIFPRRKARGPVTAGELDELQFEIARRQIGRPFLVGVTDGSVITLSRHDETAHAASVEKLVRRVARAVGHDVGALGSASTDDIACLREALAHARFAARFSALPGNNGQPQRWEDLGPWRVLFGWPLAPATVVALSDDARRLIDKGSVDHWRTVVAYLDSGRSPSPTCKALNIHRATLHYRLDKIRDIIGPEAIDDGWRAVSLHLALRLHELLSCSITASRR